MKLHGSVSRIELGIFFFSSEVSVWKNRRGREWGVVVADAVINRSLKRVVLSFWAKSNMLGSKVMRN